MRGIRFRDALTAYLVGIAVTHLRLVSPWSVTAARLHFWLTEDRGEMPTPLESYRTTETALKVYAESLAEDNDRLRHVVRLGLVGMIAEVVRELGERARAFGARTAQLVWELVCGVVLTTCTVWAATWAVEFSVVVSEALVDLAARPVDEGPPDAGVPHRHVPVRDRVFTMCMANPPRYILDWTRYERAPRLIVFAETRYYWWEEGALPLVYPLRVSDALRENGAEIFPRPETAAWSGGEFVAEPVVIALD